MNHEWTCTHCGTRLQDDGDGSALWCPACQHAELPGPDPDDERDRLIDERERTYPGGF